VESRRDGKELLMWDEEIEIIVNMCYETMEDVMNKFLFNSSETRV
jgi:hypothetical protein